MAALVLFCINSLFPASPGCHVDMASWKSSKEQLPSPKHGKVQGSFSTSTKWASIIRKVTVETIHESTKLDLELVHLDNAGCESEPCRSASMQMHSAIIRVIAVPNEIVLISQKFRQSQNASSFHWDNITKSTGVGFFFFFFGHFYWLLFLRKTPQVFPKIWSDLLCFGKYAICNWK